MEASQVRPGDKQRVPSGSWVEIQQVILPAGGRAPNVPADTAAVDFRARIRGFLVDDAAIGAETSVQTLIGRTVRGRLTGVNPRNPADFGDPVPDLLRLGVQARGSLEGTPRP